jgi:hypothetical protein
MVHGTVEITGSVLEHLGDKELLELVGKLVVSNGSADAVLSGEAI